MVVKCCCKLTDAQMMPYSGNVRNNRASSQIVAGPCTYSSAASSSGLRDPTPDGRNEITVGVAALTHGKYFG